MAFLKYRVNCIYKNYVFYCYCEKSYELGVERCVVILTNEGKRGRQFQSQGSMKEQSMNNNNLVYLEQVWKWQKNLESRLEPRGQN